MTNILSYGISLPHFRVDSSTLNPSRGRKQEQRAVIFVDEDPITLAYDAANKCLANFAAAESGHKKIDAVLFATTTPVFQNRYHASFLAELLDIPNGILALDFTSSLRAGTDALILADQLLTTGKYERVLLLAADTYFPAIGEELAPSLRTGHAGCALLLSREDGFASIAASRSYSSFIAEDFVYKGSAVQPDARFGRDAGFKSSVKHALNDFLEHTSAEAADFDAVILNSIFARSGAGPFLKNGFNAEKQFFRDILAAQFGFSGACHALMLLIHSLEREAERVLLFDCGNGTNVIDIKRIRPASPALSRQLDKGETVTSYQDYLLLRQAGNVNLKSATKQDMFSSDMMLEREKKNLLQLQGFACTGCGTVYFLKTMRCKNCKCEKFDVRKLEKTGIVFSFTREHYFPSSFAPVTMVVVDLDGGGRVTLQLTDDMYASGTRENPIGARVQLVLRKMMEQDKKPNYFWKCRFY